MRMPWSKPKEKTVVLEKPAPSKPSFLSWKGVRAYKVEHNRSVALHQELKECITCYEIRILALGVINNRNTVSLTRSDLTVNYREPENKVERLVLRLHNSLYPIHLYLEEDGRLFGIQNHADCLQRWNSEKELLLEEYDRAELVTQFVENMSATLESRVSFETFLFRDPLFKTLFLPFQTIESNGPSSLDFSWYWMGVGNCTLLCDVEKKELGHITQLQLNGKMTADEEMTERISRYLTEKYDEVSITSQNLFGEAKLKCTVSFDEKKASIWDLHLNYGAEKYVDIKESIQIKLLN